MEKKETLSVGRAASSQLQPVVAVGRRRSTAAAALTAAASGDGQLRSDASFDGGRACFSLVHVASAVVLQFRAEARTYGKEGQLHASV